MQAPKLCHHVSARSNPQVVGVAEHDARSCGCNLLWRQRLDRALRPHRHEGGRRYLAMRRHQDSGAGIPVPRHNSKTIS